MSCRWGAEIFIFVLFDIDDGIIIGVYNFIIYMGNNSPCGQMDHLYKIPLNAVQKDYNNFQLVEYNDFFQYPARFPYILSYLRKNHLLFEDIYFPINEEKRIIGANLFRQQGYNLVWKRINQFIKTGNVRFKDSLINPNVKKYKEPSQLYRLLYWITGIPKLMQKIFHFQVISKQGLILVYLPLLGSHDEPVEIVIDDLIPMREQGDYYFNFPQVNNVAMVALQKALAKCLGSYQKIRDEGLKDLFEIIVGLPILVENIGTKDQIQIFSRYYRPDYHIMSYNKKLENHHPQYFRFTLQQDSEVAISIWQQLQDPHSFDRSLPAQIVIELMKIQSQQKVVRVGYTSKLYKDKTMLRNTSPEDQKTMFAGKQFLHLTRGNYILHIYTKTDTVSINSNLITYSQQQLILTYRKQSYQLCTIKRKMIQNIFLRQYKELQKCLYTQRVYTKFIWDGFRGILAFKNQQQSKIKLSILIKQEYRRKIKFEDSQQFEESFQLKPFTKKIISFIKFIDIDVGNFYVQNISYLKNQKQISNNYNNNRPISNLQLSPFRPERNALYHQNGSIMGDQNDYSPTTPYNPASVQRY